MASQLMHRPRLKGLPEMHGEPQNLLVALEKVGVGLVGSMGESHLGLAGSPALLPDSCVT